VAGSYERPNEFSGSTKSGEILGYLRYYSIFKKDSVPWGELRVSVCVCVSVTVTRESECVCVCL
jgi:hypothetical protein